MDIKKILPIILVAFSSASLANEPAEGVGFAWRGTQEATYLYTTKVMKPDEKISVQYPGEKGVIKCCRVTAIDGDQTEQADVNDELNGAPVHRYKLKNQYKKPFVGIAVIGDIATQRQSGIEIKNRHVHITTCLSQEGVHLFARRKETVETHLYLPLGYEVQPTCTADVDTFVKNADECEHQAGEWDSELSKAEKKQIERSVAKYCGAAKKQLNALTEKYKSDTGVQKIISDHSYESVRNFKK